MLAHIESVTVETVGQMQDWVSDEAGGSWSWYDLVILEGPGATAPRVVDNRALVWLVDKLPLATRGQPTPLSKTFNRQSEVFDYLKVRSSVSCPKTDF